MFYYRLFILNIKKYIHNIAYAIIGAIVPVILIGTIVFCAVKILSQGENIIKAKVAVVTEDIDESYMNYAMKYIKNMASTSESLEFIEMNQDKADKLLKNGDIIAILYFPAGVVDGILYGENIPVEVTFNQNSGLASVFLAEITGAGGHLLSAAQAGTYTTAELYRGLDQRDALSDAYNKVDIMNFGLVLSREESFENINVGLDPDDKNSTLIIYYISSALMLFNLLWVASFTEFFRQDNPAFRSLLKGKRFAGISNIIFKIIIYCIGISLSSVGMIYLISSYYEINIDIHLLTAILIASLFISNYSSFLTSLSDKAFPVIIIIFLSGIIFPFISGAIIPLSYLPDNIVKLSQYLPFYDLHSLYRAAINGIDIANQTKHLVIWSIILLITNFVVSNISWRKK